MVSSLSRFDDSSKTKLLVREDLLIDNLGSKANSTNPFFNLADIGEQTYWPEVFGGFHTKTFAKLSNPIMWKISKSKGQVTKFQYYLTSRQNILFLTYLRYFHENASV